MAQIITAGTLSIPSLQADDAYIQIVAPPNFITGVPTDVFGVVGTASWGPVNVPQHLGSGQQAVINFGQISAASLTDPFDLATDLYLAFGQASSQAVAEAWAVRVSDGTDTAGTATISAANSATPSVATITGNLTVGDVLQLTATSSALSGSPITVNYTAKAGDTTTTMATGLAAAVNANTVLPAAGVFASAATNAVTLYWPTTVSPTIVWTRNVTGSATETITITPGSPAAGGVTLTDIYTGVLGNQTTCKIAVSTAAPNTFDVTITPPVGLPEVYRSIPLAQFWRSLATFINAGQGSVRGASATVTAALVNPAVGAPTPGVYLFAGGTDGRAGVTTATLIGSQTASPPTGLWSLSGLNPAVGVVWLAGCTDAVNAPASILAFNLQSGTSSAFSLPSGLSVAGAISAQQSAASPDASMIFLKDWIYFFDTINNQQRLVPSSPVFAGKWATLGPEQSPGNKPVNLVIGTERNNPITGNLPYTVSDIAQLEGAGIITITNPIPRGRVFGMRHGLSSSLQAVTAPAEYWRMTMYLARSAASFMGQYVDELQSQQLDDPLRAGFKLQSNNFLQILKGARQIDNFLVTCNLDTSQNALPGLGVNTPQSIAQHYLFALWQVTYLSSVRFFILSLQGGTTVVEVAGQLTQSQATL